MRLVALLLAIASCGALMYSCGQGDIGPSPEGAATPQTQPAGTPSPSSPPVPIVCTQEYVYGVVVALRDPDGDPIDDATLILSDGNYSEEMDSQEPGLYVGAGERPGTYRLSISAPGFEPQVLQQITVSSGTCHVTVAARQIVLSPESGKSAPP